MRGITHDLTNPLHAISANAELLETGLKGPLSEDQQKLVRRIRSSAHHTVAMVRDLLDTSIAEGGPLSVRPAECCITDLITEVVEEYSASAAKRRLEVAWEARDQLRLYTDESRVRQVLENLVSNAVKYTEPGGTITISAGETSIDNEGVPREMIAIDVADTGKGIPSDHLEKIFEEFWRLESHRNIPGSGLGLSVARRVATLLGGALTVESSSRGSCFRLWLPRDRRHQSTPDLKLVVNASS
jgi:signal transduction histidine kinase